MGLTGLRHVGRIDRAVFSSGGSREGSVSFLIGLWTEFSSCGVELRFLLP